jgi:oligopeptide/dipeptide ABC transporter ATP-binding protein
MSDVKTILRVQNLRTYFRSEHGLIKAVDDVSFRIPARKTLALVGESGCGKSVTALSIMQLLQMPPAIITSQAYLAKNATGQDANGNFIFAGLPIPPARITFAGSDLLGLNRQQMRQIRGGKIGMIFQEPMSSLNPVYTCGGQVVEAINIHSKLSSRQARDLAIEMLIKVGIPEPQQRYKEYPHQLSGGQRQRVMIAMALACSPQLVIADEPTTALDVTIQAQILELLRQLQANEGLSILLITHDLAVVAETADLVAVMYASKLVELTDVKTLFALGLHPYTQGLFRSLPRLGQKKHRLETISGNVPNPLNFPAGCKFHPRCLRSRQLAQQACADQTVEINFEGQPTRVLARCAQQEPPLREVAVGHWCSCWEAQGYQQAQQSDPSAEDEN